VKDYLQGLRMTVDKNLDTTTTRIAGLTKKCSDTADEQASEISDIAKNQASTTSRIEKRMDLEKASSEARSAEERAEFNPRSSAVERKAAEGLAELEKKMFESGKKLQATIDASSRNTDMRQDREHKFFLEQCGQLRELIADNEEAADKKMSETRTALDAKFTLKHEDVDAKVEAFKASADEDRKDMDASFSSQIARAVEDRLKNEIDMKKAFQVQNAAQDERNAHVQSELKNQLQYLRQDLDSKAETLKASAAAGNKKVLEACADALKKAQSGLIEDMDTMKLDITSVTDKLQTDLSSAVNERNNALLMQKSEFLENLSAAVTTLGDSLDEKTMMLTQKTDALKAQVEVDVATNIKDLDNRVEKNIKEVKDDVATRVQKSIDTIEIKMDVMNTRIKTEIEPTLKEASDTVSRAANDIAANKDRIMLLDTTLTENVTEGFQGLSDRIDDMAQGMDIATILNGLAEAASA